MFNKIEEKKIILFGAGNIGKATYEILINEGISPAYFVDNSVEKQVWNVYSPDKLLTENKAEIMIIISADEPYYTEIEKQIESMGFIECIVCLEDLVSETIFPFGKYEKIGHNVLPKDWDKYGSLCSKDQICFLLGLINSYKFSNGQYINTVLEIGVAYGGTSLLMLKEGVNRVEFKLYGMDISTNDYIGRAVETGTTQDERKQYYLHKGKTAFDIEEILQDKQIDLVIIDGGHTHPYPLIDLIHVIPFLHNESIVLLHDVVEYLRPYAWGEGYIYFGWNDLKYRSAILNEKLKPIAKTSLGSVKISDSKQLLYKNIEQIARIPFRASPWSIGGKDIGVDENKINKLRVFMKKYYDEQFAELICNYFEANLKKYFDNWQLFTYETKLLSFLYDKVNAQEELISKLQETVNQLIEHAGDK